MIQKSQIFSLFPKWMEVVLVVLAAWFVVGLFIAPNSMPSMGVSKVIEAELPTTGVDARLLQQVHLFGQPSAPKKNPQAVKAKIAPVVVSRLNIKLMGTVVAGDKSAAMVTVGSGKKQAVFFLKEEIQPNVTLEEVEPTEIVVNNRGKRERIGIEAGKKLPQVAPATVPRRVASRSPIRTDILNKKIDRNHLNSQMRNFSTLLSQARVSPHFSNGKPDGFKISEIVKGSLYEEIGLINGDIIKAVNGESVTGAEQAMRMYRELQNATFIDVEVERNGTIQQISYVIQ